MITVVALFDSDEGMSHEVYGGEVVVHEIDLGRADLDDMEEFYGWAASHLAAAEELDDDPAAYVRSIVFDEYERRKSDDWVEADDVDQLLALIPDEYK